MQTISIIGGTGELGSGLAWRWAKAGLPVIIGSRDADRAATVAAELSAITANDSVRGMSNTDAAAAGDIIVLTVKFSHQATTLEEHGDGSPWHGDFCSSRCLLEHRTALFPQIC